MDMESPPIRRHDPARFLTAMLEGVEGQIGHLGGVPGPAHPDHPTRVVQVIVVLPPQFLVLVHGSILPQWAAENLVTPRLPRSPRRTRPPSHWPRAPLQKAPPRRDAGSPRVPSGARAFRRFRPPCDSAGLDPPARSAPTTHRGPPGAALPRPAGAAPARTRCPRRFRLRAWAPKC